jgi:3-hydroxyisobutyrate dehydrogenase-like beta-hydroxyacid dehydrogenase
MSKDMSLVHGAANESGAVLPAAEVTDLMFENAAAKNGDLDLSAIAPYVLSSGRTR